MLMGLKKEHCNVGGAQRGDTNVVGELRGGTVMLVGLRKEHSNVDGAQEGALYC